MHLDDGVVRVTEIDGLGQHVAGHHAVAGDEHADVGAGANRLAAPGAVGELGG